MAKVTSWKYGCQVDRIEDCHRKCGVLNWRACERYKLIANGIIKPKEEDKK